MIARQILFAFQTVPVYWRPSVDLELAESNLLMYVLLPCSAVAYTYLPGTEVQSVSTISY